MNKIIRTYKIKLVNSKNYLLIPHKVANLWLDKFAYILNLKPKSYSFKDNSIKIILTYEDVIDNKGNLVSQDSEFKNLPSSGWIKYNFNIAWCYFNNVIDDVIYKLRYNSYQQSILAMQDILFVLYKDAVLNDGFLFHSGLIEKDGIGILLAGRGGAGKTTLCKMAEIFFNVLCDDTVLILNFKGEYFAHPFPTWSQYLFRESKKSWDIQKAVPIKVIFFLRKAKENKITAIDNMKTVVFANYLAHQVTGRWNKIYKNNLEEKLFLNICEFSKNIKSFILDFTLDSNFFSKIEEVLNE